MAAAALEALSALEARLGAKVTNLFQAEYDASLIFRCPACCLRYTRHATKTVRKVELATGAMIYAPPVFDKKPLRDIREACRSCTAITQPEVALSILHPMETQDIEW